MINFEETKYALEGQNIEERTENGLLDPAFNIRFITGCMFLSDSNIKYPITDDRDNLTQANPLLPRILPPLKLEMLIAEDPLIKKVSQRISRENVAKYVMGAAEPLIETIEEGGFSGAIVELHEMVEIHELFKSYQSFCKKIGLESLATIDSFFESQDKSGFVSEYSDQSINEFYKSGEAHKAQSEAHKKAHVAEAMFIYHLSQKLGYSLNFAALIDANPLRDIELDQKDKQFVKSFCRGFRKDYSDDELKQAKQFYQDVGCEGFSQRSGLLYLEH